MTVQSFDPKNSETDLQLTMTAEAISHFTKQLEKKEESSIRLFIEESGCSGYMYRIDFVEQGESTDFQFNMNDEFNLFVQKEASSLLQGTEIDFKKDGVNQIVKFNNPNVTAECGCGESFVVESK